MYIVMIHWYIHNYIYKTKVIDPPSIQKSIAKKTNFESKRLTSRQPSLSFSKILQGKLL